VQPGQQREVWRQHRARNWQSEHRDWHQRGGYNGYRIPEDRYRGNFGPNHWFRIHSYPVEVYGGYGAIARSLGRLFLLHHAEAH
jgi:hypothetical protein